MHHERERREDRQSWSSSEAKSEKRLDEGTVCVKQDGRFNAEDENEPAMDG